MLRSHASTQHIRHHGKHCEMHTHASRWRVHMTLMRLEPVDMHSLRAMLPLCCRCVPPVPPAAHPDTHHQRGLHHRPHCVRPAGSPGAA